MIDLRDIYSLSSFQRETRDHIRRLKRTGRPAVLTVNGKAEVVVQDAASYQRMLDAVGIDETDRAVASAPWMAPDPVIEAYKKNIDRSLLRENMKRSVQERLEGLSALQRLASEAGRAGRRSRDPK